MYMYVHTYLAVIDYVYVVTAMKVADLQLMELLEVVQLIAHLFSVLLPTLQALLF